MSASTYAGLELPPSKPEPYLVSTVPAHSTPVPEIVTALRTIPILDGLSDIEYTWLATHGTERIGPNGALVFREGEPASRLNFILRGEIHVRRHNSGPLTLFVGRAGQMTGKLPFSRMKSYGGDGFTIGPAWILDIEEQLFPAMLAAIPSLAQRAVSTLLDRVREVTRMEQQSEKLNALGKLAANLAHELNNPASAAQRSASSLFTSLKQYGEQTYRLGALNIPLDQAIRVREWIAATRERMADHAARNPSPVGPLHHTDREDLLLRWLQSYNVPNPWDLAPTLAETIITCDQLEEFRALCSPEVFPLGVTAFVSSLRVERMAETVVGSTVRIFDLISAIKDYSYMDQAPIQEIDLAQSLENTLTMFTSRLQNIRVRTEFDPDLPPISAYGSELNQVWTAIIENAIDAMPGGGTLHLLTRLTGQLATVEISNTGPGIPAAIKSRIFEPFFTTKAPGHGLGLGLDTAHRIVSKHSGFLNVDSTPETTCFQIRLPLEQAQAY